jgi:hypothetical protein
MQVTMNDRLCPAPRSTPGFAWRKRASQGTWRDTVTHYLPEPWLLALERERIGTPLRPGHRPEANR